MLIRNIKNGNYCFTLMNNGGNNLIPISEWLSTSGVSYLEPLQSLVDNGYGESDDYEFQIPFIHIYELDSIEREMIEFPTLYPYEIYIQQDGLITRPDFRYKVSFCSFAPNGERFVVKSRSGVILSLDRQDYMLSKEQYLLVSAIEEYNNLPESDKGAVENLKCFAAIKELSKTSASTLDEYLNDKNVILPKRVKINLDYQDNLLEITPSIEGEYGDKFSYAFDRLREVRDTYPITQPDGGKIHVVISPEQKEELQKLKKEYRRISDPKQIKAIVDKPESYFDTDVIDISELYSERVITIGLYEPKFYPFLSPYKSQWIPGYKIKDRTNGTTNLIFKSFKDLAALKDAINAAKENKTKYAEFRGVQLSIDNALKIEADARKQLELKQTVTDSGTNSISDVQKKRKVLIIEENTEELGFTEKLTALEEIQTLKLLPNPYLNSSIQLKNHQEQGIAWLQHLLTHNSKGCLLADDMGLGKTLQLLYLIDWHSRNYNNQHKPYLIVAPVSLLENWELEYKRFFPSSELKMQRISNIPRAFDRTFITDMSKK
ncbi:MAG: SNF2-related protein, partial [Phocaeicola sp.]